jgi:hypothetical protein
MKAGTTRLWVGLAGAALSVAAATWAVRGADAADHLDPSPRVGANIGEPADIADLFAWNTDDLNLAVALDFGGPLQSLEFAGDRDVLYTVHIDSRDADLEPDVSVHARFAQNGDGDWGLKVENLPGTSGPVYGRVGAVIDLGGAQVFAGVRDDPFFFDLQGFRSTLMSGSLSFSAARDFFAGQNISTWVFEVPLRALPGEGPYRIWATTGRIQ